MAMNIANPAKDAATAMSVSRVSWSSGCSARPRAASVSTIAPPAAPRRRETSKPGPASTPIASTRPGWPASRAASASVRKIAACCETAWRGRATPTTLTVRAGSVEGRRSRAPRRGREAAAGPPGAGGAPAGGWAGGGAIAGDGLAGAGGRAAGGQDVGRQRRAAPAVGDGGAPAEPDGHRHVADRGLDARHGGKTSGEIGAHAGALAEKHVVVGADLLLPRDDGGGAGVALDRRVGIEDAHELHAPGRREDGGGGERDERARERA